MFESIIALGGRKDAEARQRLNEVTARWRCARSAIADAIQQCDLTPVESSEITGSEPWESLGPASSFSSVRSAIDQALGAPDRLARRAISVLRVRLEAAQSALSSEVSRLNAAMSHIRAAYDNVDADTLKRTTALSQKTGAQANLNRDQKLGFTLALAVAVAVAMLLAAPTAGSRLRGRPAGLTYAFIGACLICGIAGVLCASYAVELVKRRHAFDEIRVKHNTGIDAAASEAGARIENCRRAVEIGLAHVTALSDAIRTALPWATADSGEQLGAPPDAEQTIQLARAALERAAPTGTPFTMPRLGSPAAWLSGAVGLVLAPFVIPLVGPSVAGSRDVAATTQMVVGAAVVSPLPRNERRKAPKHHSEVAPQLRREVTVTDSAAQPAGSDTEVGLRARVADCARAGVAGCSVDSSPASPPPTASGHTSVILNGTYSGQAEDNTGPGTLTWTVSTAGDHVSGPFAFIDRRSGIAGHGTAQGTFRNGSLAFQMDIPRGGLPRPYSRCEISLNAVADSVTSAIVTGSYSGTNTCSGAVTSGHFRLARQ